MTDRARTIFLGTGGFAVPIVAALAAHPAADLIAVVTAPQRESAGSRMTAREPPVAAWAAEHNVPTLRPARLRAATAVDQLREHEPDLLVLADYGQIVPPALLELPRFGALNLHPSLLPRHRGATPIPAAILAGDDATGVTLMLMDAGLDTGPVVAQWRTALSGTETAPELEETLADQAARLLETTLDHWLRGEITPDAQEDGEATVSRPLKRSDGVLDPHRPAVDLERQVRAYQPWPGSYLDTASGRIVVWQAHVVDDQDSKLKVGALARSADGGILLGAANGALALDVVQPAGGKRMSGAELLRGRAGLLDNSGGNS